MCLIVRGVVLLFMLTLASAGKSNLLFMPSQHTVVTINNTLSGNEALQIHCKSKDDDLGVHVLQTHETFRWRFGISVFGNTLFFCGFRWGNSPLKYYDIYIEDRDWLTCEDCDWYIKEDGPCRDEKGQLRCYPWNNN